MNINNVKQSSKELAGQRLKLILIHDRAEAKLEFLDRMKNDILGIINKYVDINDSDVEVKLIKNDTEEDNSTVLVANIPIRSYK